MSHYVVTPSQPRFSTQQRVQRDTNAQIEQLRRLEQRQAELAAQDSAQRLAQQVAQTQQQALDAQQHQLNSLRQSTREQLLKLDEQQRQNLNRLSNSIYNDMGRMQTQITKKVNDMTSQINTLGRNQQVLSQQLNFMAQGVQQMAVNIDRHFEENEREISNIKTDIRSIHDRFAQEDQQANDAVSAAVALLKIVEKRTMLDRFAPGYEAQDIRERINRLTQSANHGASLMAQAEEAMIQIWQIERHAVQEKAKHDAMIELALTQVERILNVINSNRISQTQVEGGEPMEIENNFWSEGEYERLTQEMQQLHEELNDRYSRNLDKDRIAKIMQRSVDIENRIIEISTESVAKAILSEARVETVEDIVNMMESKGWTVKGGEENPELNYMGGEVDNDWRKGVFAVLQNNLGEEITVIVDPDENGNNHLVLHKESDSIGLTDENLTKQMMSIRDEMKDLGYEIGASRNGVATIPQMGSGDRLGQAHATEQLQQKLHY
jgi:hypothetical protein